MLRGKWQRRFELVFRLFLRKECTARTYIEDIPSVSPGQFKGTVSRDFTFLVFSWISFPKPLSTQLGSFQIFSKICGDIRSSRCTTSVADTGGASWLANISANVRKNFKWSQWDTLGLGGNWFMKKNQKLKISWHCPFKENSALIPNPETRPSPLIMHTDPHPWFIQIKINVLLLFS
jgi:hypothetical protein